MNSLQMLIERRDARRESLRVILKTPERNANQFKDLKRAQLVGAIKAQLNDLDDSIELYKNKIRAQTHILQ